jgi:hypothetical protein
MSLSDQYNLAASAAFQQRVEGAIVASAVAVYNEVANEVQSIAFTGTVTGGTFTLTYAGQTTPAQPFNVSAASLQVALQALSTIGTSACILTGGPGPATFNVTFTGSLAASPHALFTFSAASLTGTTPGMTVTRTTAGVTVVNHAARAALASKILANPIGYSQLMAVGVASDAAVQTDYTGGGNLPSSVTDAHINAAVSSQWNAYC